MNSIYGVLGRVSDAAIKEMGRRLAHRGATQRTRRHAHDAVMGFGGQEDEGCLFSEDDVTIVCDADIYNRTELCDFLDEKGHSAKTGSDAELLLRLFQVGNIQALEKVNGDFAFSIWNGRDKQLILGRDYCGCRPLYYAALPQNQVFAFASEYKSLLALPGITAEPDLEMLQCLQYHKKLPAGRTLAKNINAVAPGAVEIFTPSGDKIASSKMTSVETRVTFHSESQAVKQLREALVNAIECRVSDPKKIGVALSGGIDSIGIAFICRHLFPKAEIHTFTAGSDEKDEELVVAERVAQSIGSTHHAVITPPNLMEDHLEQLVWHLEDPFARSESLQLFKIGEAAAPHVSSLLTGMEADALFAGMPRHKLLWWMSRWPPMRTALGDIYDLTQSGLMPTSIPGKMLHQFYFRHKIPPVPRIKGSRYVPVRTEFPSGNNHFVNSFLSKAFQGGACQDGQKLEKTFAAWGVRYRSPFLDRNLIRTAFAIPEALKFQNGTNKYILRKTLRTWIPDEFNDVPKSPQRMKYDLYFSNILDDVTEKYLIKHEEDDSLIFDTIDIGNLKRSKSKGVYAPEVAMRLWTAVLTQIWCGLYASFEA